MSGIETAITEQSYGASGARGWRALPWLVVVVGVSASIFLFTALRDAVENVARLRFERDASDASTA
jgi:hypothetical protein